MIKVLDEKTGQVEFIDTQSGTSLANRTLDPIEAVKLKASTLLFLVHWWLVMNLYCRQWRGDW